MTIKLTRLDLDYILTQIQMAEAGQFPVNPLLSFGLRTVDGTMNNMAPGQSTYGSSFQTFPSVTDPLFQTAQAMAPGALPTSYAQTKGNGLRRATTPDQPDGRQLGREDPGRWPRSDQRYRG